ncbi:hypothetical protein DFJ63DRAFT_312015 [Scheffersomyces coipomensis]|uniref:uncharacterized protein n=1 Tax=Scheffersomyces coipomensis TaxID=1788519 RepID=UPI00315D1DA5
MISKLLLIIYCLAVFVNAAPNQSRICNRDIHIPFTGYKIENQIDLKGFSNNYHLIYCNDNVLIYDLNLNSSIPWAQSLNFTNTVNSGKMNRLALARRKSFALRKVPVFLPNTLVGGLFYEDDKVARISNTDVNISIFQQPLKSIPLVADNLLDYWLEVDVKLDTILHIPVLSTPGIGSRRYNAEFMNYKYDEWSKYISASESYSFDYDSRLWVRKSLDKALKSIGAYSILLPRYLQTKFNNSSEGGDDNGSYILCKLIFISKLIPKFSFSRLLVKVDKILGNS